MMSQAGRGNDAGGLGWLRNSAARETAAVLALLSALAVQLVLAVSADGLTNDEVLYIPAGFRHLSARDYRPNPTQPPLAKLVAASGLLGQPLRATERRAGEDELAWAYRVLLVENDAARVVPRARAGAVVACVLLAALVWLWARLAFGALGGLLALLLAAFHPSLLAHGHLATTDLVAALAMFGASFAYWRWSCAPSLARAAAVGAAIGLATATRLTTLLLLPAFLVLAVLDQRRDGPSGRRSARSYAALAAMLVLLAPLVVWSAYGLRYEPWPGASVLGAFRPHLGLAGRALETLAAARALPEAFLEGARYQLEHARSGHPGYLLGAHSNTGWWSYYLVALLVKSTPGFLLAGSVGLVLAWRRTRSRLAGDARAAQVLAHALVPAAAVFAAASASRLQIGERYVLAIHPYLILVAAAAAASLWSTRAGRATLALVAALHVGPALFAARGGYLAYFNALAGGPSGAYRVLLDSNLDWGQDLPRLAAWMRRSGVGRVQLAYHGSDDPARFGIAWDDAPGLHLYPTRNPGRPLGETLAGTLAISPNLLFGLVPHLHDPYAPLRARPPDARAGIFFVYHVDPSRPLQ